MSLLLAEGHRSAFHYSVGRVYDEANLVTERQNAQMSADAVLAQHAYSAVMSKRGSSSFQGFLKKLQFTVVAWKPKSTKADPWEE